MFFRQYPLQNGHFTFCLLFTSKQDFAEYDVIFTLLSEIILRAQAPSSCRVVMWELSSQQVFGWRKGYWSVIYTPAYEVQLEIMSSTVTIYASFVSFENIHVTLLYIKC